MTTPPAPVVIVTNAGPSPRLTRCITSIERAGCAAVVIVDNSGGSAEGHWDECGESSTLRQVVRTWNDGYGAAVNAGCVVARRLVPGAAAVAVLNDDIEVAPGWMTPLVDAIDAGYQVVQPKLLMAAAPDVVNSVGVQLDRAGSGVDVGLGEPDGAAFGHDIDIEIFTGGAVLCAVDFLDRTGGFDERFFLYYEDVDLALRGAEIGARYRCVMASRVWHEGGATTSTRGDETRRLQERNRLWCAFRFGSPRVIVAACWLSVRRLRHRPRGRHLTALLGGVAGAPRRLWERRTADRSGGAWT